MAARPSRRMPALLALLLAIPGIAAALPTVQAVFTYENYVDPDANRAGETSIGVNPYTNTIVFQLLIHTDRLNFDYSTSPPTPTWQEVTPPYQIGTIDPILYTDRDTGKTYVDHNQQFFDHLMFTQGLPGVLADGDLWVMTEPASHYPYFDHQTIGSGPHAIVPDPSSTGITPLLADQVNALYTCGQLGTAVCMRSDDDGLTWGPFVPINLVDTCGGLHGHVVVDHLGVVYVPNKNCGGNGQGVERSTNNGITWTTSYVPGTVPSSSDMQLAVDGGDTVWAAISSAGKPLVSKSTDHGATWGAPVDVGGAFGIANTRMPMITAGDAGRVALAFYGTTTPGNDQASAFTGVWHLYVATTLDNGATWTTVDATPTDPVQRGCIWMGGGGNACRNLLDFQGMTYDAQGRVVIGYADGCTSAVCIGPTGAPGDSRASRGVVALQTSGPRLLAAFD
jgi:hypothetical protein